MKKTRVILLLVITAMFSLATGAFAASNLTEIKAYLNAGVKFRLDGKSWRPLDDKGKEVLPITYNGTTYLPLRVIANAFDVPITWEGSTQTIGLRESSNLTLYSKEVKVDNWSEKFYDVIDKKQLVFGNHQYEGAYAFTAENVGLGWYEGSPYLKLDFGKKYNTLHLILYSPSSMKIRVLNGDKQQLTQEISLEAGRVTEMDINLQGSQYAFVSAYDANNQAEKPLLYILKDSYVTTEAIPASSDKSDGH
ncbi:copper amine oxidase N-terminal domain-containing protein [Paenibacillus sp. KQZ6P-2]|uniref:Copper amine oxidase N-terminal domain-containing protein n=1 Tax=Paenibacillus mangrovi TaxID=2931978 RepID=A0A9X2B1T2_9BACL|nr:stalk domain-containing protein [Paenibacillus mangrovi]MCJ8011596.1 copper amine oxidase N-terminal domain-containing protein [Paenibacillus mangrovi]